VIPVEEVIRIHKILIESFGGSKGIRSREALESALARPYQTFNEQELYPEPEDKAASIVESIIVNHPFIDGNKRIGYVLMRMTLLEYGMDINVSQDEKFDFILTIAKGELKFDEIRNWIKIKLIKNVL
jgi:death-on-curing protein